MHATGHSTSQEPAAAEAGVRTSARALLTPHAADVLLPLPGQVSQRSTKTISCPQGWARKPAKPHVIFDADQVAIAQQLFHQVPCLNERQAVAFKELLPNESKRWLSAPQLKSYFGRLARQRKIQQGVQDVEALQQAYEHAVQRAQLSQPAPTVP